jgi:hypothetical protein
MIPVKEKNGAGRDLMAALFISVSILVYFSGLLLSSRNYFIGDIYTQFYPWKDLLKRSLETGVTPYWNPAIFSGVPFLADIQKGGFYPPGIIFVFLNFSAAFKVYIIVHFIIMGVSMYCLLREFGFSRVASIGAGLIFLFNTFTVTRIDFISALSSFTWMPLILLSFYRFLRTGSIIYWPLFVITCALSVLAGHPPTIVYTVILIAAFWLYFLSSARKKIGLNDLFNVLFFCVISGAAIAMLSMPQAGMFLELLGRSTRGQSYEYNAAAETSMAFTHLWAFLMPAGIEGFRTDYLRDWILYSMGTMNFFSVTAVFLMALSFFYPKNKLYMFSLFTACLSLLLALGRNTPVHSWFFTFFPFFSMLRHPGFAMTLFIIPASIMAAFTLDHIKHMTPAHIPILDRISYLSGISRRVFRAIFYTALVMAGLIVLLLLNRELVMKNYSIGPKTFASFIAGLIGFLALFCANFLLFYLKDKGKISPDFYFGTVIFMIFFELFYFSASVNPLLDDKIYYPQNMKLTTPDLVRSTNYKFLHTPDADRMTLTGGVSLFDAETSFLSSIPSNTGLIYGLNDAGGYNPVQPKDYTDYLRQTVRGDSIIDMGKLDILNVKYVISISDLAGPDLEKVYDGNFKVFKNTRALPLFFTTKDKDSLDLIVGQYSWSRRKELDYSLYNIDVDAANAGYFVFADNYYPGWSVFVDNRTAAITKCFGIFMGVRIEGGQHQITFKYSPTGLRAYTSAYCIAAGTLLFLGIGYLIIAVKKKSYKKMG